MNQATVDDRALKLLNAADRLAAFSRSDWEAFVYALAQYAEIPMMALLHSSNEGGAIHNLQGRARMAHELAELLADHKGNLKVLSDKVSAQNRLPPAQRKGFS